jgi:hypothetical protein
MGDAASGPGGTEDELDDPVQVAVEGAVQILKNQANVLLNVAEEQAKEHIKKACDEKILQKQEAHRIYQETLRFLVLQQNRAADVCREAYDEADRGVTRAELFANQIKSTAEAQADALEKKAREFNDTEAADALNARDEAKKRPQELENAYNLLKEQKEKELKDKDAELAKKDAQLAARDEEWADYLKIKKMLNECARMMHDSQAGEPANLVEPSDTVSVEEDDTDSPAGESADQAEPDTVYVASGGAAATAAMKNTPKKNKRKPDADGESNEPKRHAGGESQQSSDEEEGSAKAQNIWHQCQHCKVYCFDNKSLKCHQQDRSRGLQRSKKCKKWQESGEAVGKKLTKTEGKSVLCDFN